MTPPGTSLLTRHLLRGALGFGLAVGALALIPAVGPWALVGLPVGLVVLKGCPACWTVRLVQLLSRGRLQRACEDGSCTLVRPAGTG
ncbi:hypothetical protein [Kitasatospora camelliae]|uniref:DUF2892 family protein n=1 Tax=Kitasatospora camelliae TaxID=3156397 RepID=A0AAU8JPW0_9ACTN